MDIINVHNLGNSVNIANIMFNKILNKNIDIELLYESNFENAKILRDFIEFICIELGFSNKYIARFMLIIDELNNNAIEYGTEKKGINKLRFKSINSNGIINVIIEVEDTGKGDKHKNALEMETLRAHQLKLGYGNHASIRGRGLFMIVVKSVDRLYFKDSSNGGLIVGIKKNIKT